MPRSLIALAVVIAAIIVGSAHAAVPRPDRPMALSKEDPLTLRPTPIAMDRKCTGTVRLVEAEGERPVIILTEITCE
ncbi:hypothetical protein [Phyllobacterium leguminum]|uniref:Uncharacterized protein n=1 Tax=Phyllobacterium leguminum TaxID=314237 RepID=A0A318T5L4_9HYPH|nr:hypothetical protein [Phyllobacterium leguminum]PYE89605.1 hypothetical protein C7477_103113 [Phyllobacterium leguminum]